MTRDELNKILDLHFKWLSGEKGGKRADLRGANLRGANLRGANLTGANLTGADLRGANLTDADLTGAYLTGADLRGANLTGANLTGANLTGAYLTDADLTDAYLTGADLRGANLTGADLTGAYLTGADLRGANLRGANLTGAKIFIPMACPDTGAFIGWKKCRDNSIVKLLILEDALRTSSTGRKCRCNKAKVLEIQNLDGSEKLDDYAISGYDESFFYQVGEIVSVDNFNDDIRCECAAGIHFFITRQEAVNYIY